jgi:hypothetical protein
MAACGFVLILAISAQASAQAPGPPDPVPPDPPFRANHVVPAFDIVLFDFLLNRYGERFVDRGSYDVSRESIRRNLQSPWVLDSDPFSTNQFLHPYQGAMYHGFARSAGLNYWESLAYTFAGSMLWEIAGETTLPSRNDQIASGIGGSFLGEPLFRVASFVLESHRLPRFWREAATAVISPSTEFNRLAYGGRFRGVLPSHEPSFFTRVQFGAMGTASVEKPLTQPLARNEAVADLSIDYGLPGNPNYVYRRPFDYFNLQFTASSADHFENIFTRGLLAGRDYGADSASYRGVWGLYATYDFVSPQVFRVSSTALGLGTTFQRSFSKSTALQSTLLAGVGYGAAGTIHGSGTRDYHYGVAPQALAATRFVVRDRIDLDLTLRDYYVSGLASTEHNGSENIARVDALFTVRLATHQAVSVRYIWSRRDAAYLDLGDVVQSRGSVGLFYTFLSGSHFSIVDW